MLTATTRLGPYEIVAPLGAGGMGEVYRARDSRLGREVAVKVLPEPFASDPERLLRFEREARAVAALSHPNILAIHDYGTHEGITYAVMELLEGETLRGRLARGPLFLREAVAVGAEIAEGLAAAHAKGIVHRDLKPENLFVTADGRVKILDFGLARITQIPSSQSETGPPGAGELDVTVELGTVVGRVMGTVGYMSPEQIRGQLTDSRSDIFSFGCVLYELVSGQRAFQRDTAAETMTAILHDEPPDAAASGVSLPAELEQILRQCLAKNPNQRLQSARDLALGLRATASGPGLQVAPTRRSFRPVAAILAGLLLAGAAGATGYFLTRQRSGFEVVKPNTAAPTENPIDTLAVLPFDNQSADSAAAYLADDITYSLTDSLARVRELKVRPYGSAVRFKPGNVGADAAGRELQVQAVLRGSVQKRGDDVLIDVELIHVGDDRLLWGNRYVGKLEERLTLQQQILQEVPGQLKLALTGQEKQALSKLPTRNLKAHELYTLGRLAWNRRNAADIQKAIEYFEQAMDLDPDYALAYAGLADCYVLTQYSRQSPKLAAAKAQTAALEALELDPTLAGPRCTLATIQSRAWDFTGAERSFQLALTQEPNYSTGRHWYGFLLSSWGRHDEAISQLQEAVKLDPNSPIIRAALGRTYFMARKFDAAEAECRATLTKEPEFVPALAGLGAVYLQRKQHPEAIQVLSGIWERGKMFAPVGAWLGYAYGVSGDEPRAREVLRELQELAKEYHVSPTELAVIHLGLGAREEALTLLEEGYREKDEDMIRIKVDPFYDSLRDDPRFQKIVADMKFPPEMNR